MSQLIPLIHGLRLTAILEVSRCTRKGGVPIKGTRHMSEMWRIRRCGIIDPGTDHLRRDSRLITSNLEEPSGFLRERHEQPEPEGHLALDLETF